MKKFEGTVAVVTGGASGIGLALARRFAAEGMSIVIGDRNSGTLNEARALLRECGASVLAVRCDVADATSLASLCDSAYDRFGSVDLLCANAGIAGPTGGLIWELPLDQWQQVFDVNVFGVVNTLHAFVPRMLAAGTEGHIVVTGSITALTSKPATGSTGAAVYVASKHALLAIAESMHQHLQMSRSKLSVSIVCPGAVKTRINEGKGVAETSLGGILTINPPFSPGASDSSASGPGTVVLDPAQIADRVVEAIRAKRLYVFTHADSKTRVMDAFRPVVDALDEFDRASPSG